MVKNSNSSDMQQQSDTSTSAMIVVKLEEQDSVKSFDCGDEDLNRFFDKQRSRAERLLNDI